MDTKQDFENMPVAKAVLVNAVPAMLSMLVTLVYNVADTFFIGQTGDEMQVAAVSLATPVFLLFMSIGTLFGIGGTSVISRAFGEGKEDFARTVGSFCFWMSVLTGVLCILAFLFGMDYILQWIGASGNTEGYARSYLLYIAWSAPFVIISTAFSNIVRAEGKSTDAMNGVLIGTLLNIVLDPVFILWLGYGIVGAAWATVIGYVVATAYYIFLLSGNRSRLTFSLSCFNMKKGNGRIGICHRHPRIAEQHHDERIGHHPEPLPGSLRRPCGCRGGSRLEGHHDGCPHAARAGARHTAAVGLLLRCPTMGAIQGGRAFLMPREFGDGCGAYLALLGVLGGTGWLVH